MPNRRLEKIKGEILSWLDQQEWPAEGAFSYGVGVRERTVSVQLPPDRTDLATALTDRYGETVVIWFGRVKQIGAE